MSPWEVIGWLIVVPMALMTLFFVFAVSGAVVMAIVRGAKPKSQSTVSKEHPSNVTPLRRN